MSEFLSKIIEVIIPIIPLLTAALAAVFNLNTGKKLRRLPENTVTTSSLWEPSGYVSQDIKWAQVDLESRLFSQYNIQPSRWWIFSLVSFLFCGFLYLLGLYAFIENASSNRGEENEHIPLGGFFDSGVGVSDIAATTTQLFLISILACILLVCARHRSVNSEAERRNVYLDKVLASRPNHRKFSKNYEYYRKKIIVSVEKASGWNLSLSKNNIRIAILVSCLSPLIPLFYVFSCLSHLVSMNNYSSNSDAPWINAVVILTVASVFSAIMYLLQSLLVSRIQLSSPNLRVDGIIRNVDSSHGHSNSPVHCRVAEKLRSALSRPSKTEGENR
ncbi:hypothetical protein [Corynebacterium glyciniphilum]|uniref:hypothetical protein n=1 Tax=Corynebacterium glyciniphilum TaxID=1404244 RepID=UPI0011AB42DA|nr:hypothetical protein [Corynebacterium glyciniphilum]